MEKREPSYIVGGTVSWCSHYGEHYGGSLKKLKIELPYNPVITLLGIYLEKTIIQKDTCTPMFTAALFTIARTWKQRKCPSSEEWIKKMWYIYTMEYYSAREKNEIMPFAAIWMDLEIIILSETRQRKTNIICITHMWNLIFLKKIQMNLLTKQKQTYRYQEQTYGYQRGNVGGGINQKLGMNTCTLLHVR